MRMKEVIHMNVKECYTLMGGDYDEIMYLMRSEARIIKYLKRFKEDQTMQQLTQALEQQDYDLAFRCAHTLKGVSVNLNMMNLATSSNQLTTALREQKKNVEDLYLAVKQDYDATIKAIDELLSE